MRIKRLLKNSSILLLTVVFYSIIFSTGMFTEYKYQFFKYSEAEQRQQIKEAEYFILDDKVIYNCIYDFICMKSGIEDPVYLTKVTEGFMELFDRVSDDANKQNILYFIAMCGVESNFKMNSKSSAGAIGISQVMWSVWHRVIQEDFNITKNDFYNNINDNIYVGYRIFRHYWIKNDYNQKAACYSYLGAKSSTYVSKVHNNYVYLANSLYKYILNNSTVLHIPVKNTETKIFN